MTLSSKAAGLLASPSSTEALILSLEPDWLTNLISLSFENVKQSKKEYFFPAREVLV